ncbi:hypothetical protein NF212_12590 [Parasalinivibrio latis]|uniref:capsular polysaccharide export protein, LipB/KpsS family n=1 Tax=Parasalinivibrio latis TaxID=2952610 RepID=UPI0030DFF9E3
MKQFPFNMEMLDGNHSAYGMSLVIEKEFEREFPNITQRVLNLSKFYCHTEGLPKEEMIDFFVIWGVSPNDDNASTILGYAVEFRKPVLIIEDGFLRSFFPMSFGEVSASIRLDTKGCYYDASFDSSILNLLNDDCFVLSNAEIDECSNQIKKIIDNSITKYFSPIKPDLKDKNIERVLVIDQVFGDMSIMLGGADDKDFEKMLHDAISENPNKEIVVKLHPESILGIRKGHYTLEMLSSLNITAITDNINSIELLKQVDTVYCVTTQMGFEALMCGKEVIVYGKPFYAGWGLTKDRSNIPQRNRVRTLEELFYAAYHYQVVYFNPKKSQVTNLEDVLDYFVKTSTDVEYINGLKLKRFDLRLRHLEKKILEIESLKETSITLDKHVYQIKSNYAYLLGLKLERIIREIKKRVPFI